MTNLIKRISCSIAEFPRKAMWDSFQWSIFTLLFGLLQIWIIMGWDLLSNPQLEETIFEQIMMGGALLFFSVAIVSSLTVDHYISQETFSTQDFSAFFLFPMVIIISSIVVFFSCFGKSSGEVNFELVVNAELIIISTTMLYAFGIKYSDYRNSNKGNPK
jgi:hypothetical protein